MSTKRPSKADRVQNRERKEREFYCMALLCVSILGGQSQD